MDATHTPATPAHIPARVLRESAATAKLVAAVTAEIAETLRDHTSSVLREGGVTRSAITGADVIRTAGAWARYGFTSATVERWLDVGVYDAATAAELVGFGLEPTGPVWSEDVAGLPIGVAVSETEIAAAEVAARVAEIAGDAPPPRIDLDPVAVLHA